MKRKLWVVINIHLTTYVMFNLSVWPSTIPLDNIHALLDPKDKYRMEYLCVVIMRVI